MYFDRAKCSGYGQEGTVANTLTKCDKLIEYSRNTPTTTVTERAFGRNSTTRAATDKRTAPQDSLRRPQQEYLHRSWGNNYRDPFPLD